MTRTMNAVPLIAGGSLVAVAVALLAFRRLRGHRTSALTETDLSTAEWHAAVEFESTDEGKSG